MRLAPLALAAFLALAGCGKEEATGNTSAIDRTVTAEDFAANDVTAIDAATGADANMAADVDFNMAGNADTNDSRPADSGSPRAQRAAPQSRDSAPAAQPAPAADEPAGENAATNSGD